MTKEPEHCLVCGAPVKALGLCSKHHQRYLRSGSVYLKNEKVDSRVNIDILLPKQRHAPKEKLNLSRFI